MSLVYYPAVLEKEEDSDYGVFFPDLPGVVSAGDDPSEALANAEEALQFHIDGLIEEGDPVPEPGDLAKIMAQPGTDNVVAVAMIQTHLPRRVRRVNLTFDEQLLSVIDAAAVAHGYSRSAFLAEAARRMMRDDQGPANK